MPRGGWPDSGAWCPGPSSLHLTISGEAGRVPVGFRLLSRQVICGAEWWSGKTLPKTDCGTAVKNNHQMPPLVTALPATAEVTSAGGEAGRVPGPPLHSAEVRQAPGEGQGLGALCPPVWPKDTCGFTSFSSQLDSKSVKHTALSLISIILKRASKTIDYCLNKGAWQESGVYTAAMMEDFVRLFREALSKVGPGARLGLCLQGSQASTPEGPRGRVRSEGKGLGCSWDSGLIRTGAAVTGGLLLPPWGSVW